MIGIQGTLEDGSLGCGNDTFPAVEEQESRRFNVKKIKENPPLQFGGCVASKELSKHSPVEVHQKDYTRSLKQLDPKNSTGQEFAKLRRKMAYIAAATRPLFRQRTMGHVESDESASSHVKLLNSSVTHIQESDFSIKYPVLEENSIRILRYADMQKLH